MSNSLILKLINFNVKNRLDDKNHFILSYLNGNKTDLPYDFRLKGHNNIGNSITSMSNQLKQDLGIKYDGDMRNLKGAFLKLLDSIIDIESIIYNEFEEKKIVV